MTINGIKSEKAVGKDEIGSETLKALTEEGMVNASVSSFVEVWKNSQRLEYMCDYFNI